MKNDPQGIPSELFDWMEAYSFGQLDPNQRKRVLEHFGEEEYESMHLAAGALSKAARVLPPRGREKIKEELLTAFDRRPATNSPARWMKIQFGLGKVAALVVLFSIALTAQYIHFRNVRSEITGTVRMDTLIVQAEAPQPILIRDTVVLRGENPSVEKTTRPVAGRVTLPVAETQDLYITGTDELDRPLNKPKRNSLEQDSLIGKYGFVTM